MKSSHLHDYLKIIVPPVLLAVILCLHVCVCACLPVFVHSCLCVCLRVRIKGKSGTGSHQTNEFLAEADTVLWAQICSPGPLIRFQSFWGERLDEKWKGVFSFFSCQKRKTPFASKQRLMEMSVTSKCQEGIIWLKMHFGCNISPYHYNCPA